MAEWDVSYSKTTRNETSRSRPSSCQSPGQGGCGLLILLAVGLFTLVAALV